MSDQKTSTSRGGIGLATLLTIIFVILKLTHVIDWPWIWVLAPAWISVGVRLVLVVVVVIFIAIVATVKK